MKLVLDARMIRMSGIGRYIQSLLSFLVPEKDFKIVLLGKRKELFEYSLPVIEMETAVYSPLEQIELAKKIPPADVFWSPHFNVPFLNIPVKKRLVTIHDVFHITPHSTLGLFQKWYAGLLIRNAVYKSDVIFTISDFTKSELIDYFHLKDRDLRKIRRIYQGVSPMFCEAPHKAKHEKIGSIDLSLPYLLYVGNVKPHKNVLGLLQAFQLILKEKPELRLVIVGQKENFITGLKNLDAVIKEQNMEKNVVFTGVVGDQELVEFYRNAQMLVLPSFYEGFGYPPVEAMACGCPAVVSDIPVQWEIYGESAQYIKPDFPESIARGVLTVLSDEKLRKSMIQKGRIKAAEFTLERNKEAYLTELRSLF